MRAMQLQRLGPITAASQPLVAVDVDAPEPGPEQVLVRVSACGVCHTELDEIEGRLPPPRLPVIPGHQVVGTVVGHGARVDTALHGTRVGVAWIFSACGACPACQAGNENICSQFVATGRDVDGGYAQHMVAPAAFAVPIPDGFADAAAAPLLCAGAIGYRSLRLANLPPGGVLGLTGFGASAHLVLQMVRHQHPDSDVFVFARSDGERAFARELGAAWTGDTAAAPPAAPAAIIDTTPAWTPVLEALKHLAPGGRLVINAIRKEAGDAWALATLDYASQLWMEKEIKSVANVTRRDVSEFLALAASLRLAPEVQEFALEDANRALAELKTSHVRGAKVLRLA